MKNHKVYEVAEAALRTLQEANVIVSHFEDSLKSSHYFSCASFLQCLVLLLFSNLSSKQNLRFLSLEQ